MTVLLVIAVWMFVSQAIAWMIAGDDPDMALDMWSAVFLLVPMGIGIGICYLLALALRELYYWTELLQFGHAVRRQITVDDIVP